jgi:hypothetical protein
VHGRRGRILFLSEARRRLSEAGPLLLSFFARAGASRELRMTRAVASAIRRLQGRVPVELGDTLAPNLVHVFTQSELERELAAAGLELVEYRVIGAADEATSYASAVARAA